MRLGIQSIDFHAADEEDDETHVPLAFHKRSIFETEVSPVGDRPEYLQGESGISELIWTRMTACRGRSRRGPIRTPLGGR